MPTAKKPARPAPSSQPIPDDVRSILATLQRVGTARVRDDMGTRYGITGSSADRAFGVPMSRMRALARQIIADVKHAPPVHRHDLAAALWDAGGGQNEARMVA